MASSRLTNRLQPRCASESSQQRSQFPMWYTKHSPTSLAVSSHERNEPAMFRTPARVSSQRRSVVCLPSGVYIIEWKLCVGVSTYHDICQFMTKLP